MILSTSCHSLRIHRCTASLGSCFLVSPSRTNQRKIVVHSRHCHRLFFHSALRCGSYHAPSSCVNWWVPDPIKYEALYSTYSKFICDHSVVLTIQCHSQTCRTVSISLHGPSTCKVSERAVVGLLSRSATACIDVSGVHA
jgi:hypothetical protein